MPARVYVHHTHAVARGSQKKVPSPLALWTAVYALGTEPRPSAEH